MQGSSSCPGPGASLQGSGRGGWPGARRVLGKRRRGLDLGRALKPHSPPWSEIPHCDFCPGGHCHSDLEPP